MGTDDISTAAPADVTAGGDQDQTSIIIKVQNADELRLAQMGMLCCSSYIYIYIYKTETRAHRSRGQVTSRS